MRVVVASDALAGLSAAEASETIARAFAERGAEVVVVPLGVTGAALSGAVGVAAGASLAAPSDAAELGPVLAEAGGDLVLDLTSCQVADLGREALDAFGANPVTALKAARDTWAGRRLVALVPEGQPERPLTGLTGLAATEGRERGMDLASVLSADSAAGRWAAHLGLTPEPGAGSAGGAGLLIQAMGGIVTDPLTYLVDVFGLAGTLAQADVVVTGAESLDFHAVGGPVVKRVVSMAGEALRPVIAVVGRNFVSARELRLAGLEAAYPLTPGADGEATPRHLADVAARVATTWSW
ncbi:glycerate kinase [Tessaracoccus sp. G1721]